MFLQSKHFGLITGIATGLCISAGVGILPTIMATATQDTEQIPVGSENAEAAYGTAEFSEEFVAEQKNYKINENGLTYGTAFFAETIEEEPDLIAVIGDHGVEGYVYKTDLEKDVLFPSEETDQEDPEDLLRTMNVFESDGVTVIDTFTVGGFASSEKPVFE